MGAWRRSGRRFRKVEPLTKRITFHRFAIASMSELDDEFAAWLCEARALGDGVDPGA